MPRHKKGEIWLFLAEQHKKMCNKQCDLANPDTPYRELLGQLTTQQHAILVDLGELFIQVIIVYLKLIINFSRFSNLFHNNVLHFIANFCLTQTSVHSL